MPLTDADWYHALLLFNKAGKPGKRRLNYALRAIVVRLMSVHLGFQTFFGRQKIPIKTKINSNCCFCRAVSLYSDYTLAEMRFFFFWCSKKGPNSWNFHRRNDAAVVVAILVLSWIHNYYFRDRFLRQNCSIFARNDEFSVRIYVLLLRSAFTQKPSKGTRKKRRTK